jgi:hypothetical protein
MLDKERVNNQIAETIPLNLQERMYQKADIFLIDRATRESLIEDIEHLLLCPDYDLGEGLEESLTTSLKILQNLNPAF